MDWTKKIVALSALILILFSGCKSNNKPESLVLQKITFESASIELVVDDTKTLTPILTPAEFKVAKYDWQSSDPAVATVSDAGVVTALAEGMATIKCTASGISGICRVVVSKKPIPVQSITLNPSGDGLVTYEGSTLIFTATVEPADATENIITWESTNPTVATVADGTVTALAPGETTITASAGGQSASAKLTVKMKIVDNFLARFADYNLEKVNTFASGESTKPHGQYFQYGRNVTFKYGADFIPDTTLIKSTGSDMLVYSSLFIAAEDWIDFEHSGPHTWKELVDLGTNSPSEYVGNNGGDPCPAGYHVPAKEEWIAILPERMDKATFDWAKSNSNVVEEIMIAPGQIETFTADYKGTSNGVAYGIKMKSESNKYLTAFKWEWNNEGLYLKISSVHLGPDGANTTIDQITAPEFWKNAGDKLVVKYFPVMGFRYFGDGVQMRDDRLGYYWSSSSKTDSHAWDMMFYKSSVSLHQLQKGYAMPIRCVKNEF